MGRKEKTDTGTRITPLTEGGFDHYSLDLPILPDVPWDPVEYDPDLHDPVDVDDDSIDFERLQNFLGDPSKKDDIVVIDTRDYNDFLQSRLVFAKHIDEFQNAEAEILMDECDVYSIFVLYDKNGRTLSLMDSPLSKMYDFLRNGSKSWTVYILAGGFDRVQMTAPQLLCRSKKKRRYDMCPSMCDSKVLWGNSDDFHLAQVTKRFGISHIVSFESHVDAKMPSTVESLFVKVEPDSVKLYDHFEELFKFLLLGKSEQRPPSKLLLACSAADNRSSAAVIAYMMFRHHWCLQDAFTHVVTRRKSVQIGKNNLKALQKLEKKLFGKVLTKSMPKLKPVSQEREEEEASDAASSIGRREKKKKTKKKKGEDSDSELKFSDDEKTKKKKTKTKKKKDDDSDSELKFSDDEKTKKREKSVDLAGMLRIKKKRRPSQAKEEEEEEEEEGMKKRERRPSRTKERRKSLKQTEEMEAQNSTSLHSPEQDSEEERERRPRPKKRGGLLKLRKNASEGLEAAGRSFTSQ